MVVNKNSTRHEVGEVLREELEFKVDARRNKLLGLWLAEHMALDDAAAKSYATEVVIADLEEPGDEDVIRKVMADVTAKELSISEADIREKLNEFTGVARAQIREEAED